MGEAKRTVLLADDTNIHRRMLVDILKNDYEVFEARDGEETLSILEEIIDRVAIVLLDIVMPKKDGFDVLEIMNERGWISKIPVIMITAEYSEEYISKANRLGAIDYIIKPFNFTIVSFRVASTIALYDKQRKLMDELQAAADKANGINPLTGLVSGKPLFEKARKYLSEHPEECCVIAIDIEHFKMLNDTYGRARGDDMLRDMAEQLLLVEKRDGALCGYIGGDDFILVMPYDKSTVAGLSNRLVNRAKNLRIGVGVMPVFGVYIIKDRTKSVEDMYDRAMIAATHCLGNYHERMCIYEHWMMAEVIEESDRLEAALEGLRNEEFTFYLQPQCDIETGKIVGAEALARWVHDGELIPPYKFIPVMEKNDVVSDLDLYLWEQVCKWLRKWIDAGNTPVPISINVSRMDIYTFDLPAVIRELITTYELDPKLLKVEITESSYIEEFKAVNNAVDTLQDLGFRIFMDDFGSGYSSLNMLTNVNIDVLKIDMMFLDLDEGNRKGFEILDSVVKMAKLLHLPVVVEGVENKKQLDVLRQMNCDYAQGYYFYQPMSVEDFEKLIKEKGIVNPNANFSKYGFEDENGITPKIQVTEKELQDTLFDDFRAIYLMDVDEDCALALRLSEE
ncbi:MAG: EAL domain-containing protein, partial [Lachnospiraceae bacterium]|nr:EAL domain-containing protein [Lachnospiraceae bacterium]